MTTDPAGPNDTQPLPDQAAVDAPAEPRRRRIGLIVGLVVLGVLVLVAVGAIIAEQWARQYATDLIAQQVREALQLEPEHPVAVTIDGASVLLQAAGGRLDRVTAEVDDYAVGALVGDLTLIASGTPLDVSQPTEQVQAVMTIDEADVSALAGLLAGAVDTEVQLDDRELRFETGFSVFGFELSLGVGLTPTVEDGQLAFTPSSLVLGGERIDAADLERQFGALVTPLLETRLLCVADQLPAALPLSAVQVGDAQLVIVLEGNDVAFGGDEFTTRGTCA